MKRSKRASVTSNYNHLMEEKNDTPREVLDAMLKEFLDAGGKIYKSERGRRKGKLTKKQTLEHNKEVSSKIQQSRMNDEKTDRKTDENGEQVHNGESGVSS